MATTFHKRWKRWFEGLREKSLYNAALRWNMFADVPIEFSQDSMEFLFELSYSLPHQGIIFIGSADEFLYELIVHQLPPAERTEMIELRDLQEPKERAVGAGDFETAAMILGRQKDLREKLAKLPLRTIEPIEIWDALRRDGIDLMS